MTQRPPIVRSPGPPDSPGGLFIYTLNIAAGYKLICTLCGAELTPINYTAHCTGSNLPAEVQCTHLGAYV